MAAQLAAKNYHVLLGSRSEDKGNAAIASLKERGLVAELIKIDVTDDSSIEAAAEQVKSKYGKLDVLVNNAGIAPSSGPLRQQMSAAFDANATGCAIVTETFHPLLQKGSPRRIVNVSSGAGSITSRLNPESGMYKVSAIAYRASKAAMNMVTADQHVRFGDCKVFAFCPGFTVSNLSDMNKAENGAKSAKDAVMPIIDILEGKRDDEAGKFLHNTGTYSW